MPRKSIFRRNKNKVEKPEETPEEPASLLKRSSGATTLEINDELYNEINSFGNALANDGSFQLDNNVVDASAFAYQPNEELLKPALKKKERKPRKKRGRKSKAQKAAEKAALEAAKCEPVDEPAKEDIMAKLKAMEAERNAVIAPIAEALKPKPKLPTPEPAKEDIMAKLKALEATRNVVIKPVEEKLPTKPTFHGKLEKVAPIVVVKPKTLSKDVSEKMIMSGKDYNIRFNANNQTKQVTTLTFSNDSLDKDLFRVSYNNQKNEVVLHQHGRGKWNRITRLKLRNKDFKMKIKFAGTRIPYRIAGNTQCNVKRCDHTPINKCTWTMDGLTIV